MSYKVQLVKTCGGCPEQYDGYIDGQKLAYFRLRHGGFRAEYRDEVVYTARPNGDGVFEDDERERYLNEACQAVLAKHNNFIQTSTYFEIIRDETQGESDE